MTVAKRGSVGLIYKLSALALTGMFTMTACLGGAAKPTEVKITSPQASAALSVGQSVNIEGVATGDSISRVEVMIDGNTYARLEFDAKDATKGIGNFPVRNVPWTPISAGTHAIQLKAFGPPDYKLVGQSEPLVVNALASAAAAAPTAAPAPTQPLPATKAPAVSGNSAGVPTVAPPPSTGSGVGAANPAPAAGSNNTSGAPSLTVTNDFVNVRTGPDTAYDKLGELQQGATAAVKGKSADGKWWQIAYPGGAGGVGWVIGDYVQTNGAANNTPVASAPPKPTAAPVVYQPPAPAAPAPVLVPLVTVAPPQAAAPQPAPVGQLVGPKGVLRVNANPVGNGATVYASWNIPNFKEGKFDRGDGQGAKGPISQVMQVDVPSITSQRIIRVQWTDTNGGANEDTIVVNVSGSVALPAPVTSNNYSDCNSSNPDWRGNIQNNNEYQFCTRMDMAYSGTDPGNVAYYHTGDDVTLKLHWDIYGIGGLYFMMEANGDKCGPGGNASFQRTATGNGEVAFNIKDMGTGGYKMSMRVIRRDGKEVRYNEKFLCVGTGQASSGSSSGGSSSGGSSSSGSSSSSGKPTAQP